MNDNKHKLILALALISKGEPLNNCYKLTRMLEWKFRVVDAKAILDEIKEEHYAGYEIVKGLHFYNLTLAGAELLKRKSRNTLDFLLREYPHETDIIKSLFTAFAGS